MIQNKSAEALRDENGGGQTFVRDLPPRETFEVEGHAAFVLSPEKKPDGRPWVWYAPTLSGYPREDEEWMFRKFLDAGMAVAGIDAGESYGSPGGRALFSAFYKHLVGRGFSQKPCLLPRSRGGLMLYNWAAEHPSAVACVAGIYPVCDLTSYPGLAKACGAYEMTEQELESQLERHNPVDRIGELAKARVPIFHIHGDRDDVEPLETNSAELVRRYRDLGGEAVLEVARGQGHTTWRGFFESRALTDFVIAHAVAEAPNPPGHNAIL